MGVFLCARYPCTGGHGALVEGVVDGCDEEGLLRRNVKRFRGGLVFKAHGLVYHSIPGLRIIKEKKKKRRGGTAERLEKGIQTPVAQGRSSKIISMIKCTRTSRLSTNISLWAFSYGRGTPVLTTRWTTTLSSTVNLLHSIDVRALFGANLVEVHRVDGDPHKLSIQGCLVHKKRV